MAATPSTPPPSTRIRDPPTPRYGSFYDEFEPYAPRKSARFTQRLAQTPPPQDQNQDLSTSQSTPPTTIKKVATTYMDYSGSPPPTVQRQSRKKLSRVSSFTIQRASGSLEEDTGYTGRDDETVASGHVGGMLPTPVKTPNKKSSHSTVAGISAIARNLFPVRPESIDEVMPTPRKRSRKKIGSYTLVEEDDEPIQIFTDSSDRVPEIDVTTDNPFYVSGPSVQPVSTRRTSKRRKVTVPGEGEKTIEEIERRDDGLLYVFRGKKIFRKFSDDDEDRSEVGLGSDTEVDAALDATVSPRLRGRLTRSSIKPRLLFPPSKPQALLDEEEAVTDIEDVSAREKPATKIDKLLATPTAPRLAPTSPPTTTRSKRFGKEVRRDLSPDFSSLVPLGTDGASDDPPVRSRGRGVKVSPFDAWKRTKAASGSGTKRSGDPVTHNGGDAKRVRRHAS